MAKFKKGEEVWIEYPNGRERLGRIVAQVRKRSLPCQKKYPLSKRPIGMGRGHISYVVRDWDGEYRWPLVKYLRLVNA